MPFSWGGTFQATAGFQVSGVFQEAVKWAFRCILSVNSHLVPPVLSRYDFS